MVRAFFVLVMSVSGFHFSSRSVIAGPTWQEDPDVRKKKCVGFVYPRVVCKTGVFVGPASYCQFPEYQKPCFVLNPDGSTSRREYEGKIVGFYAEVLPGRQ